MLKHLSNNLNTLMAREKLNADELARAIGIPATTIKRIRKNEQANPTISTLLPIAEYFSISLDQLISEETLMSANDGFSIIKLYSIPLLSMQDCSNNPFLVDENLYKKIYTERIVSIKAFALLLEENELEFFPKNSILIAEPEREPEAGDYVVVKNITQGIASIRKYIIELDKIYLMPLIKGIDISILTPEYKILGVIIQYKVELKPEQQMRI